MPKIVRLLLLAAVALVFIGGAAGSQNIPSSSAKLNPTPIPLEDVASQSESASAILREIEANLEPDKIAAETDRELPLLTREVEALLTDSSSVLTSSPSLDLLSTLETTWQTFHENLVSWNRDLARRAAELDAELGRLDQLANAWEQTLKLAQGSKAPSESLELVQSIIAAASQTRDALERQRRQILRQQNRVAQQDARVTSALASVQRTRRGVLNRLLSCDSPPIWKGGATTRAGQNFAQDSRTLFSNQIMALRVYSRRQRLLFLVHLMIIVLLLLGVCMARPRAGQGVKEESSHQRVGSIFEVPLASTITLSFILTSGIYIQAPRLLRAVSGAGALIPATIVLRRLIDRHLFPIFDALLVFYFVDQVRILQGPFQFCRDGCFWRRC